MRNVPPDPDESVSEHVEHFFCVNHADTYLMHQVCIQLFNIMRKYTRTSFFCSLDSDWKFD